MRYAGPIPGDGSLSGRSRALPGIHDGLIYTLSTALNATLPEGYYSRRQVRLYVVEESRDLVPDATAFRSPDAGAGTPAHRGSAITMDRPLPVHLRVEQAQVSEPYVEIRHKTLPDRVVTVIEILSHANKSRGSVGWQEYRKKQREILASDVNLVEIDLLRHGEHTAAAPYDSIVRQFGTWDYLVSASRPYDRSDYELWLVSIRQPLPEIKVPLLAADADCPIDLQAAFDRCYDEDRYDLSVRYDAPALWR